MHDLIGKLVIAWTFRASNSVNLRRLTPRIAPSYTHTTWRSHRDRGFCDVTSRTVHSAIDLSRYVYTMFEI